MANPHEYALTYGTPVPGYAAPQDTVGPATRVTTVLGRILVDGAGAGVLRAPAGRLAAAGRAGEMDRIAGTTFPGVPPTVMARGFIVWTELFGAVSFELFGRLVNVIEDREAWFAFQVTSMARYVGVRP